MNFFGPPRPEGPTLTEHPVELDRKDWKETLEKGRKHSKRERPQKFKTL